MLNKTMLATLALGAAISFAGPAFAEKFKATLNGKSEVPPNTSTATGTADIDYDAASKKLTWKVTYSGLSGPATAAHFHGPAEADKNAGVAVAIPNAGTSPVEGSATLTDAQAADLLAGKYYVNFHTAANPGGEIRGQVMK
jgi:CHRD domain